MTAIAKAATMNGVRMPSVSVLLPAWNDAAMIGRCLESLLAIDWPDLEIIVCAGGQDGTLDATRRYENKRVIVLEQHPGEGKQGALRRCFAHSRGEIIYLTDADCVVPAEAFFAVLSPLVDGRADAATGACLPLPEQRVNALVRYQWGRDVSWSHQPRDFAHGVLGANCALRRVTIETLNVFDADVPSGTDYHLSQQLRRAGVKIAWTQGYVYHDYPDTARAYVRMWRRWIKNVLVQGMQTGSHQEVFSTGLGVGFAALISGLPVTIPVAGRRTAVPWLALLGYAALKRFRAHRAVEREGLVPSIPHAFLTFPGFVMLDAAAAVSGLIAALVPSMRRAW